MIQGKFLAIHGLVGAVTIAAATVSDWSTWSIAIIGIAGALTTAVVGMYTAFRAAKHKADLEDTALVQPRFLAAQDEIAALKQQVTEWRTLYQAATRAQTPNSASSAPTAGATRDPQKPRSNP
jgi:hypothetical protein